MSQMRFDGMDVSIGQGKFKGSFEIDEEMLASIKHGDVVTFVVTAEAGKAEHDRDKKSDLIKRTNTFEMIQVVVLDAKTATTVLRSIDANTPNSAREMPGQTNFMDDTDAGTIHVPG